MLVVGHASCFGKPLQILLACSFKEEEDLFTTALSVCWLPVSLSEFCPTRELRGVAVAPAAAPAPLTPLAGCRAGSVEDIASNPPRAVKCRNVRCLASGNQHNWVGLPTLAHLFLRVRMACWRSLWGQRAER